MESHWLYKGEYITIAPEGAFGFIYCITNLINDKKYIGRKYLGQTRRKPLTKKQKEAGRVRKTVVRTDSNWKIYTGSNLELNADIKQYGKDQFKFEIIEFGNTKGIVNYLEVNLQHKKDVILREDYYNDAIGSKDFVALRGNKILKKLLL